MSDEPTHDALESLFVNNEKLDQISAYLNRFNPIHVMRMADMEIRHSAVLAWLLDPAETHGFGDRFLKAFLGEALRGRSGQGRPTALDVSQSDLRDAEVRRERHNIDLLVLTTKNSWAFVIENKFHSKQYDGQLSKNIQRAESILDSKRKKITVRGIFLTLYDEDPQDVSYAVLRYAKICEILPRLIEQEGQSLGEEVRVFLSHYLEVIRDAADMSEKKTEMEELARQLYRSHKKVLDFVIEHGAGSAFALAARNLFGENPEHLEIVQVDGRKYAFGGLNNEMVSFLPQAWFVAFEGTKRSWPGCEEWWSGLPLISWLQLVIGNDGVKGSLRLYAEVGPLSNHEFRKSLVEDIKSLGAHKGLNISFRSDATVEGTKYSKFLKGNTVDVKDVHDVDEISDAMEQLLSRFESVFAEVSGILPKYVSRGLLKE
jgi:hypothetical protein